ncbi:hypothetical protein DB41_DI00080 [Neochlamydia sp. TUME1]|uniref:hypothetical protein n=1 Tax=Neochlamydia sp. TUME1 TaxID=1478174 RepID=UPI00057FEF35|nr:hypothetical protein [Neochlamydia sp. TUME1]KIC77050.1 hypothetical protein DB41_DI00080 [Neochlamydia sp. TUME1]
MSFFGTSNYSKVIEPTLYIHIPKTAWNTFTGKLREYYFLWRWKTAYLDQEDGAQPRKILICTSVRDSKISDRLNKLIGKSWCITNLINRDSYHEIFRKEFLSLSGQNEPGVTKTTHTLGETVGTYLRGGSDLFCYIYRQRSFFSLCRYHLLKNFLDYWKEISIQVGQISEKIVIKKFDEAAISRSGLEV